MKKKEFATQYFPYLMQCKLGGRESIFEEIVAQLFCDVKNVEQMPHLTHLQN